MNRALGCLMLCLLGTLSGCASNYGVAEIRYMEYSRPSEETPPNQYIRHARSQAATRTLFVEGTVVDDFCDALQWCIHEKDRVKAPNSLAGAVLVVPKRENAESGQILELHPNEIDFIGIWCCDDDWGRTGTFFPWTQELVKAWHRLLDNASESRPE